MRNKNKETNTSDEHHINSPWHLWLMGLLFIFIYANGVYDYFMMLGHNTAYYSSKHYGQAVIEYFTDYPIAYLVFYTTNIFCGLISPILLLLRTRWAMRGALASAVSMLCLDILTFAFRNRWNVLGPWVSLFDMVLLLMTWGFFFYCRAITKKGVLK